MIMGIVLVLVAAITVIWMYNYWKDRDYWKKISLLRRPPTIPFLGNGYLIGKNSTEFYYNFMQLWETYERDTFKLMLGRRPSIVICKPKDFELMLTSTTHLSKTLMYEMLEPWMGKGILLKTGEKWREVRKIVTPAFHFQILVQYAETFNEAGNKMVVRLRNMKDGEDIDLHSYVTNATFDAFCSTAMGFNIDAENTQHREYMDAVQIVAGISQKRVFSLLAMYLPLFKLLPEGKLYCKNLRILHKMTNQVMEKRKCDLKDDIKNVFSQDCTSQEPVEEFATKKRLAFLDVLLLSKTSDGKPLPDQFIEDETNTFMAEGHETSSSAMNFTLYCLSKHPDIQTRVYDEQLQLFENDFNRNLSLSDLNEMHYLDRVLKETLRMYPSIPLYGRKTHTEFTLSDGSVVPAGTDVLMPVMCMHMDDRYFPEPHKFDPDRFLPGNPQRIEPYSYLPFSAGVRNCIGQKMTVALVKCLVSKMVQNFEILPFAGHQIILKSEGSLKANNGYMVRLKRRHQL